jgi:hypothetical protein
MTGSAQRLSSTPAFAAGLERSGKPVRQHALVICFLSSAI